jgi:hypothetical protein
MGTGHQRKKKGVVVNFYDMIILLGPVHDRIFLRIYVKRSS